MEGTKCKTLKAEIKKEETQSIKNLNAEIEEQN